MSTAPDGIFAEDLARLRAPVSDTHDLRAPDGSKLADYVAATAADCNVEITHLRASRTRVLRKERVRFTVRGERRQLDAFIARAHDELGAYERDLRRGAGDGANETLFDRLLSWW
jgi:hypothetical protein